ncbi:hypothetical protein UFOVP1264_22 [uncultured Caudovirales phage]|uniref:Uncharacterized protein n=1 Tax=uncultured Caudovirales phage TaxID=2100421 RepID=A0A6J5RK41_9CAUD|nr:hypothetical protein UFOVP1264_22 [uncultured Caudovirales phage]
MYSGLVSKGTNIGEYPYLPENIREWRDNYEPTRRNPISPIQALSAGILMAQAQAASTGIKLTKKQARRAGRNTKNLYESRAMLYTPLGRGSVMN